MEKLSEPLVGDRDRLPSFIAVTVWSRATGNCEDIHSWLGPRDAHCIYIPASVDSSLLLSSCNVLPIQRHSLISSPRCRTVTIAKMLLFRNWRRNRGKGS